MLTQKQVGSLKRGNISINAEKTKARVVEDFKAASAADKKAICDLAGVTANTFYVVKDRGTVSAKHVAALAQVLNVTPYYYIGEVDEKKPCNDEIMEGFFKKYKDSKPASAKPKAAKAKPAVKKAAAKAAPKAKMPAVSKAKAAPKAVETAKPVKKVVKPAPVKAKAVKKPVVKKAAPVKAAKPAPVKAKPAPKAPKAAKVVNPVIKAKKSVALDVEALIILLEGLAIRAEFSNDAKVTYEKVKELLTK
jgi:pyruvate/2-oxoglutarate dehydrogenase complex dihydrolipoamide acyltransferase (E2) component